MNTPKYYVVRNDAADSWQLCGPAGMPCMARGTAAAAVATGDRLACTRANGFAWPVPVFYTPDDDTPAQWRGQFTASGEWTARN